MSAGDVLFAIAEVGLTLKAGQGETILKVYPAEKLTPELVAAIRKHKAEIIKIMGEDEEMCRTGVIQCERQVIELAREHFGLDGREGAA